MILVPEFVLAAVSQRLVGLEGQSLVTGGNR